MDKLPSHSGFFRVLYLEHFDLKAAISKWKFYEILILDLLT